jgi:hypothetical protein
MPSILIGLERAHNNIILTQNIFYSNSKEEVTVCCDFKKTRQKR